MPAPPPVVGALLAWLSTLPLFALALTLGTIIVMKDVTGLSDPAEIVANLQWAAAALLRTALEEAASSP